MAEQNIDIKVSMENDKKSRKAFKIAAGLDGIESTSFFGSNQIAVTGEGVDSVKLTTLLRKSVGYRGLMTVGNVEGTKPVEATWQVNPYEHYYYSCGPPYYYGFNWQN